MADAVLAAEKLMTSSGVMVSNVKAALVVAADSLQHLGQVAQAVLPVSFSCAASMSACFR